MKKIIVLLALFSGLTVHATEVRELTAICESADHEVTVLSYPHADVLKSGMVDFAVSFKFGNGSYGYMINDVKGQLGDHEVNFVYDNGDIVFDLLLDNTSDQAGLLMDEEGHRIELTCREAK